MKTLEITRADRLQGSCEVPGDKSIAHRAIILGSIASGNSKIKNFPSGDDNLHTLNAMKSLGARIDRSGSAVSIGGVGLRGLSSARRIECGNSGTSMRLLAGLCAALRGKTLLDGDDSLRLRPMRRIQDPLQRMGATIEGRHDNGDLLPPLVVQGASLQAIDYELPIASAQVKSAILLAGLSASGVTRIHERGRSRDHTERMLANQGAPIRQGSSIELDTRGWDRRLEPLEMGIPGDLSSAAFLITAATLVPGSEVAIRNVGLNPTRTGFLDVLRSMGAKLETTTAGSEGGEPVGDILARGSSLRACEIRGATMLRAIDEIPVIAVAATQASGVTKIRDGSELRRKESDRIATVVRLLRQLGAEVTEYPDGMDIEGPTPLSGGRFGADDLSLDHRIAMSLAVAGLISSHSVLVSGADAVSTSFPNFAQTLRSLGASVTGT